MAKDVEQLSIKLSLESGDFTSQIKAINSALSSLEKQFKTIDKGLDKNSFQHYALEIDKARKSIDLMNKEIEIQQKQQKALAKTLDDQIAKRQKLIDAGEIDTKAYKTNEKNIARNQKVYDNLTNSITNNQAKIKNWANEILDANTAIQKLENNAKSLEEKLSKVSSSEALKSSEYAKLNAELGETGHFFQRLGSQIGKLESDKAFNTQKIRLYNQEISRLENSQTKLRKQQQQLNKQISQHESSLSKAMSEYGEASQEVSQLEMSLAGLKDELREVNQALDSNHDSLNDYKTQVNNLEAENTNLDRSLSRIKFDTVGDKLQSIGSTLKNVGSSLTQNVTVPMATAGVAIAKMGMDYQNSLAKVGTITKLSGKELQNYGEQIIKVSNETGVGVNDLMESVYDAVSSGVEVGDAINFVHKSANLAKAGFAEQTDVVNLLTNAYNIYGDALGEITDVSDKFIKTQDLGKTTVGELSTEMSEAMAIGKAYGVNLDNILTSYAMMTNAGYSTAESTTKISAMLEELGDSGSKVGETFQQVAGKSFKEFMQEGNSLYDALKLIKEGANLSNEGLAQLFGSSEAGLAVLGLLSEEAGSFNSILKQVGDSSGATQEALNKLNSTAGTKFMKSINELKNSLIDFGLAMTPFIEDIASFIKKVAEALNEMDDGTKEGILKMAGVIMALGPVISMLGSLASGLGTISKVAGSLASIGTTASGATGGVSALVGALGGVGATVGGLSLVAGALVAIATAVGDSTSALSTLQREWGNIGTVIGTTCEMINGVVQMTFGNLFEILGGLGKGLGALLKGDFSEIDDIIRETMAKVKTNAEEGWSDFTGTTNSALKIMRNSTQEQMNGVKDVFNTVFKDLPKTTSENLDATTDAIVDKISNMTQGELTVLEGMGGEIGAMLFDGIDAGMNPDQMREKIKRNLEIALQAGLLDESQVAPLVDAFNIQFDKCLKDSGENFKQAGTDLFNQIKEGLQSGDWEDAFSDASKGMDNWTNEMLQKQASFGDAWGALMDGIYEGMDDEERYEKMLSNFEDYCKKKGYTAEEGVDKLRKEQQEEHKLYDETAEKVEETATAFEGLPKEVRTDLVANFQGTDEELYNIHEMLNKFDEETQIKLKSEGFKEVVQEAESVSDIIEGLAKEDKLVEIITTTNFEGGLTPEELQLAIDKLPEENRTQVITQMIQEGQLTIEGLEVALSNLPTETQANVITQILQNGTYSIDQLEPILTSLPPETLLNIITQLQGADQIDLINQILASLPEDVRVQVQALINGEQDLETTKQKLDELDNKTATPEVSIEESGEGTGILEKIKQGLENLKDKEVKVSIVQAGADLISGIGDFLSSLGKKNEQTVTIKATVGEVDMSKISNISIAPINIKAKVSEVDKSSISSITVDPVKVGLQVDSGALGAIKSTIASIGSTPINVTVNTSSAIGQVNALKSSIAGIVPKPVNITANASSAIAQINSVKTGLASIKDKTVKILADSSNAMSKINNVKSGLNGIKDKTVKITVNAGNALSTIRSVSSALAGVRSKTVSVSVNKTVTETTVPASVSSARTASAISTEDSSLANIPVRAFDSSVTDSIATASARASSNSYDNLLDLSKILPSIDFDVNIFKNLEEALEKLESELGVIDQKMENAFGQERVRLLQQQIPLLRQQQQIQEKIAQGERQQNKELLGWLSNQGFKFDALGNITNYVDKLVSMEKNVKSLKDKYDALNDVKEKDENATKSAQKAYDNANEALSKTKDYLEEYFNTSSAEVNEATEKWYEYQNAIIEVEEEIKALAKELKELNIDSGYKNIERDMAELQSKLNMNETILDRAEGQEAVNLLKERIELTGKLQKEVGEMLTYETQLKNDLISELNKYGLKFRDDGSIVGYGQAIANLKQTLSETEFETVFEMVEQYLEKVMETIPELRVEIESLNNEILDAEKEIQGIYDDEAEALKEAREEAEKLAKEARELAQEQYLEKISYAVERVNNQFDELENKIDILDALNENSNGNTYIDYLYNKVALLTDRINLANASYKELMKQSNSLRQELYGLGVSINGDGSVSDLSGFMGDEDFSYIQSLANEYESIQKQLKDMQVETAETNSEIETLKAEIEETYRSLRLLTYDNKLSVLTNEFEDLSSQLDEINNQLEYTYGTNKVYQMTKAIEIMNKQLDLQSKMMEASYSKLEVYQRDLTKYGFNFDEDGDISNFERVMETYANSNVFDELTEMTEEYFDIQSEVRNVISDYKDLESQIKDVYREQLEITENIEKEITEIYEKEYNRRKEELEAYHDSRIKLLNEERDAYKEMRDEQDYEESVNDQIAEIELLRKQVETARRDTSVSGEKRLAELMKELTQAEEELAQITQNKIDQNYENNIEKEIEKLEEQQGDILKSLEQKFSEENIAKMVTEALTNGFVEMGNEVTSIQDALLKAIDESAEGYSVMADVIKNEMVANLNVALSTMQQLGTIYSGIGIDLSNVDYSSARRYNPNSNATSTTTTNTNNISVDFNPTFNVSTDANGNVNLEEIEEKMKQAMNEMLNRLSQDL